MPTNKKEIGELVGGYTELEHITSDGNQFIDTGVNASNNVKVEVTAKVNSMSNEAAFQVSSNTGNAQLTNSVAENLIDYNIEGNSEQLLLPDAYQQTEYLEGLGAQYIDTGVPLSDDIKVEAKVNVVSHSNVTTFNVTSDSSEVKLENSITENIVDAKIYGNSKQIKLPDEYTQVEYIESTGTQYIDTGFIPNQDTRVEMKAQYTNKSYGNSALFGTRSNVTSNAYTCILSVNDIITYTDFYTGYNTSNIDTGIKGSYDINIIYKNKNELHINNDIISTTYQEFVCPSSLILLACDNAGVVEFNASAKLYYTQIWDNETLVRNLIPAVRNSDGVAGMFDTVNEVFYTNQGTGTFAVGSVCPTPEAPIEVKSLGETTRNLFDKDTMSDIIFAWINTANQWAYAVDSYSVRVPCKPNTDYCISENNLYNTVFRAGVVDSNDVPTTSDSISLYSVTRYSNDNIPIVVNTGNNAKYIVIQIGSSQAQTSLQSLQVEEGSVATEYVPYHAITIKEQGKNLFDINTKNINEQSITDFPIQSDGSYLCVWSVFNLWNSPIPFNGTFNTQYTLSLDAKMFEQPNDWYRIGFVYSDGTFSQQVQNQNTLNFQRLVITSLPNKTVVGIGTNYAIYNSTKVYVKNVQIEEGSVATSYEPYQEPIETTIDLTGHEPLRKIDSAADYIDYANNRIVRNVGRYVITGEETWDAYQISAYPYLFYSNCLPYGAKSGVENESLCNYYKWDNSSFLLDGCNQRAQGTDGTRRIYISDKRFASNIARFKTWLAQQYANGTPVIIYFKLNEAIYEPLNLPVIHTINSSTLEVDGGTLKASACNITYYGIDSITGTITNVLGVDSYNKGLRVNIGANAYQRFGNASVLTTTSSQQDIEVVLTKTEVKLNNNTYAWNNTETLYTNANIYLFKANGSSTTGDVKLYYYRVYQNNELVQQLIPCYRKVDNVRGLYDTRTNTFYLNSGSAIFNIGSNNILPSPSLPVPVTSLGKTTKNMFNDETSAYNPSYFTKTSSHTYSSSNTSATFIYQDFDLEAGVTYTGSAYFSNIINESVKLQFRNASNAVVATVGEGSRADGRYSITYTPTVNGRFRFLAGGSSTGGMTVSNIQLEIGDTVTPYVSNKSIVVKEQGINLYNPILNKGLVMGVVRDNSEYQTCDYIDLKDYNYLVLNQGGSFGWYSEKSESSLVAFENKSVSTLFRCYQKPAGARYVRVSTYKNVNIIAVGSNSALETVPTYEPYQESIDFNVDLTGHDPLRKVGNVADYIDYENNRIVRRIGKYVVVGNEPWNIYANGYYYDYAIRKPIKNARSPYYEAYCNYAEEASSGAIESVPNDMFTVNNSGSGNGSGYGRLFIAFKTRFASVPLFKSWLSNKYTSGQPLIIYYQLETPTYEPFSVSIPTLFNTVDINVSDARLSASAINLTHIGIDAATGGYAPIFGIASPNTGLLLRAGMDAISHNDGAITNMSLTTDVVYDITVASDYITNSISTYNWNKTVDTYTGDSIQIFKANHIDTAGSITLYKFKMYSGGVLIRDYIPCARNSDNAVGLFDLVNGQFVENSGTGSFVAGPDVATFIRLDGSWNVADIGSAYHDGYFLATNGTTPSTSSNLDGMSVIKVILQIGIDSGEDGNILSTVKVPLIFDEQTSEERLLNLRTAYNTFDNFSSKFYYRVWGIETKDKLYTIGDTIHGQQIITDIDIDILPRNFEL